MGGWLSGFLRYISWRGTAGLLAFFSTSAIAALYASWDYLIGAPWPLKALAWIFLGWIALWLLILLWTYLNTPRFPAAAPRFVLWHKLPIRKVSWDIEGYLGYGRLQGRPVAVNRFGVRYKVNWGEGIVPKRAYIECKRTGTYFDALTDPGNNFVKAEDAGFIPRGRWHSCDVQFGEMTVEDFLTRLDGFWFVFEYDDDKFRRYFSRTELEGYLNLGRRHMVPSTEPRLWA